MGLQTSASANGALEMSIAVAISKISKISSEGRVKIRVDWSTGGEDEIRDIDPRR